MFDIIYRFSPYISYILLASGIILVILYIIKKALVKGFKEKYNIISRYEVKVIMYAFLFWITAMVVYPVRILSEEIKFNRLINFLIILVLGLSIAYVINYILKHFYPDHLNKRLYRLRYKPRISPKTGRQMQLLSEEEEDVYLDEGMQAEEDVFSVDYDVWIDEETGYTQIEKYSGKYTIKQCPKCSYQTLKIEKEELLIAPTIVSNGELLKRYRCTYCGHTEKEIFNVAKLKEADRSNPGGNSHS
jgi:DNA-directed RNA polymerase subunit RPC12/RpoP